MFGKNSFSEKTLTSLTQMIEDRIVSRGYGAAKFTRSDKRTVGFIYFQEGQIYAASMSNYFPNFLTRIVQSGYIDAKQLEKITRYFGDENLNDPKIPDFVADNFMMETSVINNIKQDFFLEIFETIMTWENVNAEWRANESTNLYKISPVDPTRILNLVANRNGFLEKVADELGVGADQLKKLTFKHKNVTDFDDQTPMVFTQMMNSSNGEWTVNDVAGRFGLTVFACVQALYELWKADFITVIYDSEYPLPAYVAPIEAPSLETEAPTTAPVVIIAPQPVVEPVEAETAVEANVEPAEPVVEVAEPVTVVEAVKEYENDFIDDEDEEDFDASEEEDLYEVEIALETLTENEPVVEVSAPPAAEVALADLAEEVETVVETEEQAETVEELNDEWDAEAVVETPTAISALIAQVSKEVASRKEELAKLTAEENNLRVEAKTVGQEIIVLQEKEIQLDSKAKTVSEKIAKLTEELNTILGTFKNLS